MVTCDIELPHALYTCLGSHLSGLAVLGTTDVHRTCDPMAPTLILSFLPSFFCSHFPPLSPHSMLHSSNPLLLSTVPPSLSLLTPFLIPIQATPFSLSLFLFLLPLQATASPIMPPPHPAYWAGTWHQYLHRLQRALTFLFIYLFI